MRRKRTAAVVIALLVFASCGDKIQVAKTVMAFVNIGIQTTDGAFVALAKAKRAECLKQGVEGSEQFVKCFAEMAKALEKWGLIKPKLERTAETASSYIKAAESGESADYATAVKQSVCLLTEVYDIIPDAKWKKKIKMFIDLAGAYACDSGKVAPLNRHGLKTLKLAYALMRELLGSKV